MRFNLNKAAYTVTSITIHDVDFPLHYGIEPHKGKWQGVLLTDENFPVRHFQDFDTFETLIAAVKYYIMYYYVWGSEKE